MLTLAVVGKLCLFARPHISLVTSYFHGPIMTFSETSFGDTHFRFIV